MTNKYQGFVYLATAVITAGILIATIFFLSSHKANAALTSIPATVATTSVMTIGPSTAYNKVLNDVMGTSTVSEQLAQCTSRVISTRGESAIMIAFSQLASTTLSGAVGNLQAASTTVAYDSGVYGCGYWTFFAYATTTITVTEYR